MSLTTPATRPEPVKVAGQVAGALSGLGTIVVALGWLSQADVDAASAAIIGVVSAVMVLLSVAAPIVATLRARGKVTPLADPQDAYGTRLVAVDGRSVDGQYPAS